VDLMSLTVELLPPLVTYLAKRSQGKRQSPLCKTGSWSLRKKVAKVGTCGRALLEVVH
jgi:hypothetical protein